MHDIAVFNQEFRASKTQARIIEEARQITKETRKAAGDKLKFVEAMVGAAVKAKSKCTEKYNTPMDIENEVIEASSITFIHGFLNYKAYLQQMVLKLDLRCLRFRNSDKKVRAFSSNEDESTSSED